MSDDPVANELAILGAMEIDDDNTKVRPQVPSII